MNKVVSSAYIEDLLNIKFSKGIALLIDNGTSIMHFPRSFTVVNEGDTASCVYSIISGVVRGYYIDADGNDITKCFSAEGEFFSSEGLRTGGKSSFTIECIEDCVCICIPYSLLHELADKEPHLGTMVNALYMKEVGKQEKRSQSLLVLDAEERYKEFIKEYPNLNDRVPLKYVASYIGVRAASLSRIRKKLKT